MSSFVTPFTLNPTTFQLSSPAVASVNATCTAMSGSPQAGGVAWQPPLITAPAGMLSITLDNRLVFTTGTGSNTVPTSLVIVGQLGGGLGDATAGEADYDDAPVPGKRAEERIESVAANWIESDLDARFAEPLRNLLQACAQILVAIIDDVVGAPCRC